MNKVLECPNCHTKFESDSWSYVECPICKHNKGQWESEYYEDELGNTHSRDVFYWY
jgi:hypothetical protein